MRCLPFLLLSSFSFSTIAAGFSNPLSREHLLIRKREQLLRSHHSTRVDHRDLNTTRRAASRYANTKAKRFHVNGKTIPEVDFDVGDSWSGLLPISSDPGETRKLFFWYFPPSAQGNENDLIFWTNGGPGCSSLEGFLQENGPISWQWGQAKPTPNPNSWTNLGHMLWVEQPIGTGFSQGIPSIHDETELAAQLVGFMQEFLEIFSELKGKNFYLAGESYAGLYVPYIADFIYSNPDLLDLKVQGIWLGAPVLTQDVVAIQAPAVNFVHKYENVFAFNQSFLAHIDQVADACHYTSYLSKFLTYPPPPAPFPLPGTSIEADPGCDVYSQIIEAALLLNPAFNIYRIFDMPPVLWDVLGFPGTFPQVQVNPVYFNRPDVKAAIHAPTQVQWTECGAVPSVFVAPGDTSPPATASGALSRVIEHSARTVIVSGLADFVVLSEGTRIAIQNMTWSDQQGFQNAPSPDSFILDGAGAIGTVQSERGLTLYEVAITGHMVPQFNPPAAFQSMQYLLGVRNNP
ncbi:Alpha/Beta hydrolase protein [Multifurca ochricompacta]|uniref:Carboxypeptidase n=1 Tax=Multifurca ochricompacta TaxID=376703 RepID=A0AAD4LZ79_9AGAM|nr:Alpha/Beta hydrolase protein [Multifurca ochricompacta]